MYYYNIKQYTNKDKTELVSDTTHHTLKELSTALDIPASTLHAHLLGRKASKKLAHIDIVKFNPDMSDHRLRQVFSEMRNKDPTDRLAYIRELLTNQYTATNMLQSL
jgi:hypothetical protein